MVDTAQNQTLLQRKESFHSTGKSAPIKGACLGGINTHLLLSRNHSTYTHSCPISCYNSRINSNTDTYWIQDWKRLLTAYKAARERVEELFAEDDMEVQTFSGFKTGKGTPITASKTARERAEEFFAEDDMDDPRIPKTPGHVKTVPSIQPAQSKGFGFSSGKDNALTASTRLALANPHGIHARSLAPIKPGLMVNRLPSITPEHQSFSIGVSSAPQQSAISPHMINLRLKSLRAATSGSSQPGLMKSKMPFKSPMKRLLASTAVGVPSNGRSSTGDNTSAEDVSPSKNSGLDKRHAGKRVLHPNARITSIAIAQPPSMTHAPRYTSLFHLPGMLNGFEYVAPEGYVSKGVI